MIEDTLTSKEKTNPFFFGEKMSDGRLTADFDETTYHFRDLIKKRTDLGRVLTAKELAEFEIK
jgi:hypothetical protein